MGDKIGVDFFPPGFKEWGVYGRANHESKLQPA